MYKRFQKLVALVLTAAMLAPLLPLETLAHYADPAERPTSIVKADGTTEEIGADWETTFPYGTFAFSNSEGQVTEGDDPFVIHVYRLGGTQGRATARVSYTPALAPMDEEEVYYGSAAGMDDIIIEVEDTLPIAQYQPVGKDPDPEPTEAKLQEGPNTADDAEEGDVCISLAESADSYQWYVLSEDGEWTIAQGANEAEFIVSGEDYDGMDFRCVFTRDGTTYCTDSIKGEAYEKPEPEVLEDPPEDLELNPDPTFTKVEWDDPYYSYFFNVTFADGEWVKDIRVTAVDDNKVEAVKAGAFTIVSCEGGSLYDSANTLALAVFDNEAPEPSVIGFAITRVDADKSDGTATLTVKRTGGTQTMVTVPYTTKDGTAKAGEDYQSVSGSLMFYGDVTEQTIEVPLINDGEASDDPVSFQVELGDVVGDNQDLVTMDRTIATVDLTNSNTAETENLVTMLKDDGAVDASRSITEAETVAAPVDREVVTGTQVKDDSEPLTATISGMGGDTGGLGLQTYDYGRLSFSRYKVGGNSYTTNYWVNNLIEASGSYPSDRNSVGYYRNWTGSGGTRSNTDNGGFKIEGQNGGPRAYLEIPYMSQMFSYYYISLGFSDAILNTDLYGAEFVYPWSEVRTGSGRYDYVDSQTDWDWGLFTGYHYTWKTGGSMNKTFDMSSNLKGFTLGLSKHDAHDADKGTAKIEVRSLYLTRRTLSNDLQLRVHTANDGANSGTYNVETAPQNAAALSVDSGVYDSMKPTVTVLKGQGGVNTSGKLYVGSTIEVELKNTDSYRPFTGQTLTSAVYVSDENGKVITDLKATPVTNTNKYQIKMVWDGMREADLDKTYVINVVMSRVQDLKLDISPSVARQKNNASAIDTTKIGEAWDKTFWNSCADSSANYISYGVSDTTKDAPHFSKTGVSTKTVGKNAWSTDGSATNPEAVKVLSNIENLQWINFNRSPEDRILYNGRIYAGNQTIYLDVGDLALRNCTFRYYNKDYLSATSIMTTDINSVGIYLDANGNGQIDGYFNQDTNYFILAPNTATEDPDDTLDLFIQFLDPNTDYDETTFAPVEMTINGQKKYVQCFAKVLYTMTPRSIIPPVGLDLAKEKAQVLPAFVTNITDPDNYAELTKEQQSYRYIMSGRNQSAASNTATPTGYARSADNHVMYGGEAGIPQVIDVPLGGDISPAQLNAAGDGYEWTPNFQGNLLMDFPNPEPIIIEHSEAGDDIPIANYTVGDDGTVTLEDGGKDKLNGYLGSFTANSTITLCTQRQEKESQAIWTARHGDMTLLEDKNDDVKPEASNHSSRGTYPNSKYLQNMDAGGETDEGAIDMGDSPNEFDELNVDLGVKLPSTDIALTDFFTILMDGYEVGFCIGIPLASANTEDGGKRFTDNMASKGEDFGKMRDFLKNRKAADVDDSYKNATKPGNAQQLNTCGVEASLSLSIAFLFKYNSVDNGYYFSSFAIALNGSVEFKYQHRLKPAPIVYLYVKVGAELELGTGATVERETVEGKSWQYNSKDISKDNLLELKKGKTQYFDGPEYKAQNITFDGKIAIVLQEKQSDGKWYDVKDSVKGYLKSEGGDPITATLIKQNAMKLPDGANKVYRIKITALEDTKITGMVEVEDMSTKSYWSGVNIEPSLFLEVGGGIGIEILKFELFIKVSVECAMTLGAYNDEIDDYDPFEFNEFHFGLALGFRVVLIAINYEMDLIGYSVDFEQEKRVNGHSGWSHSWHALGDLFGDEIGELSAVDSEGNYYGVKITLPGDASRTQTIYSNDEDGGLSTQAYNANDKKVPFQLSGYGSSGDGFKLADGLLTGYAYQVVTVGDTNYLIYTIGRKNTQHALDNSILVLSKLKLTNAEGKETYGLVNPLNENDATPYILLDTKPQSASSTTLVDDGAGDLDFRAWVDGNNIRVAWVSYAAPTTITAVTKPDEATNPVPTKTIDGKTVAMDENNFTQFSMIEPTKPTEVAKPTEVTEPNQSDYYEKLSAAQYAELSETEKANYTALDDKDPPEWYYTKAAGTTYATNAEAKDAYEDAVAAYQDYQTDLKAYQDYQTELAAYNTAKAEYDKFMAWYNYFSYTHNVQQIAANAAKTTVVKTASFDTTETTGFTEAKVVSGGTGAMVYLPGGQGDGSVTVYARSRHMDAEEKKTATDDLTAYLTKIGYDPTGATLTGDDSSKEAKRTVGSYRLATQVGTWDGYGKGTDLYVSVNGTPTAPPLSLADGQILDNFEVTKIGDTYYLAYTTSEYQYTDGSGNKVTDISQAVDQLTIKRLFLRTFTVSGNAVTWTNHGGSGDGSKGVLLRTLYDFDVNAGTNKDGIYANGVLVQDEAYNDPYFGNLQFLNAKLGDSLKGKDETFSLFNDPSPEEFLLFEMNGATFVIKQASLQSIVGSSHTGQIIPFFAYEAVDRTDPTDTTTHQPKTTHAESTGRAQATIGADGDGNLSAVYVAPVTGTSNNAVYISKYDPLLGQWGAGTMLAMNHMDVYEASAENDWTAEQLDQAYMGTLPAEEMGTLAGKTDKGGMDQFTFGSLQVALGQTKSPETNGSVSTGPNDPPSSDKSTVLVLAQGTTSYLKEYTNTGDNSKYIGRMSDGEAANKFKSAAADSYWANRKPGVGVYALSFGVGGQAIGHESLTFSNYDFSAGAYLHPVLTFTNTGDVGIRGSQGDKHAILVTLNASGDQIGTVKLAEWEITSNIVPGQEVKLTGDFNLPTSLPIDTVIKATVTEGEYYKNQGGTPFAATTDTLLTVAAKPELGFESLTIKPTDVDASGNVELTVNGVVGNRGTEDAQNVTLQFSYDTGEKKYEGTNDTAGTPVFKPLSLIGNTLSVGKQEELSTLAAPGQDLDNGIILLKNSEDGSTIKPGYCRTITGKIKVSPDKFRALTDSLSINVEIFSDNDTYTTNSDGLLITTEHADYNSIDNLASIQIEHNTFFSVASKVVIPMGNTMRLPVSVTTTTGATVPQIAVTEFPDSVGSSHLGVLYYQPGTYDGKGRDANASLVLAPSSTGSGLVRIQDINTNGFFDVAYTVTEAAEGINIFNDTTMFTFYNDSAKTKPYDPAGLAGDQNWSFDSAIDKWGADETAPYLDNLSRGKVGACFTFDTKAQSIDLVFNGKVKVESTFPGFAAQTIEAKGGSGDKAEEHASVKFGNNSTNYTHTVTITILEGAGSSDVADFDRLVERFGSAGTPLPAADAASPHIYWSRSFPDTASIESTATAKVPLTAYILDDGQLASVSLNGVTLTKQGDTTSGGSMTVHSDGYWEVPLSISENGTIEIAAVDSGQNRTAQKITVDWFNTTITSGASAEKPTLEAKLMKAGDPAVELTPTVPFTKNDTAYISATAAKSPNTLQGDATVTVEFISVDLDSQTSEPSGNGLNTVTVSKSADGTFPADNNGWYLVTARNPDSKSDQWTAVMVLMDRKDDAVPVVTLTQSETNPQSADAPVVLDWSVTKKNTGTVRNTIKAVTINGMNMSIASDQTAVSGSFQTSYGGAYTAVATDTAGNTGESTYTLANVPVRLASGKTESDLFTIQNAAIDSSGSKANGSITIPSVTSALAGGTYLSTLSDGEKAAGNYVGNYEWNLVKADEPATGDALTALLSGDGWTTDTTINNLEPGSYVLYVRDRQEQNNDKTVASFTLLVGDETITVNAETAQMIGQDAHSVDWTVTKGEGAIKPITAVTINGYTVYTKSTDDDTSADGSFPVLFAGTYQVVATDGDNTGTFTCTIDADDAPIQVNGAKTTYRDDPLSTADDNTAALVTMHNPWVQTEDNGAIKIDPSVLAGGQYDANASTPESNQYKGSYEWTLYILDQFDREAAVDELTQAWLEANPDADPDNIPDSVLDEISAEADRLQQASEGTLVGREWANQTDYKDLKPGTYKLVVRDKQNPNSTNTLTVVFTLESDAIDITATSIKASSSADKNGQVTVTASGGYGHGRTYEFIIRPIENKDATVAIPNLTRPLDADNYPGQEAPAWVPATMARGASPNFHVFTGLPSGWYQVAVRPMLGVTLEEMAELSEKSDAYSKAAAALDAATAANEDFAKTYAVNAQIRAIDQALTSWRSAGDEDKAAAWAAYLAAFDSNATELDPTVKDAFDTWQAAGFANGAERTAYSDAVKTYVTEKVAAKALADLAAAEAAYLTAKTPYEALLASLQVKAKTYYTDENAQYWANAADTTIYVDHRHPAALIVATEILPEDLTYPDEDTVGVNYGPTKTILSDDAEQKLIEENAAKDILATSPTMAVLIPSGTLSAGDDVSRMLMPFAQLPKEEDGGNVVLWTGSSGESELVAWSYVAPDIVEYIASKPGSYSIISNVVEFTDVPETFWGHDEIGFTAARAMFSGVGEGRFNPSGTMTRAMFVTVLGRMEGVDTSKYASAVFNDVEPNTWYGPYVAWAAEQNIVNGVGEGRFAPNNPVTREQICTILCRYLDGAGLDLPKVKEPVTFPDADQISDWSADAVSRFQQSTIVQGDEKGYFNPKKNASRAEGAAIFARMIKAVLAELANGSDVPG